MLKIIQEVATVFGSGEFSTLIISAVFQRKRRQKALPGPHRCSGPRRYKQKASAVYAAASAG
jgi:hypothetical protein